MACMCVYGASPGLLSQLNGMVWMLIKLPKVNSPNQNLSSQEENTLRGSEHIIYKRQDNKSNFKSNGPCSVLGLGGGREEDNHKEWRIRAG